MTRSELAFIAEEWGTQLGPPTAFDKLGVALERFADWITPFGNWLAVKTERNRRPGKHAPAPGRWHPQYFHDNHGGRHIVNAPSTVWA